MKVGACVCMHCVLTMTARIVIVIVSSRDCLLFVQAISISMVWKRWSVLASACLTLTN
eukprot:m.92388 g.92388  ORF g.92388 m.92388 type:complete len:58 (+) comp9956_c0_seq1:120-293(+)